MGCVQAQQKPTTANRQEERKSPAKYGQPSTAQNAKAGRNNSLGASLTGVEKARNEEELKITAGVFTTKQEGDIRDDYTFQGQFGEGTYGKVYKAIYNKNKEVRVVK